MNIKVDNNLKNLFSTNFIEVLNISFEPHPYELKVLNNPDILLDFPLLNDHKAIREQEALGLCMCNKCFKLHKYDGKDIVAYDQHGINIYLRVTKALKSLSVIRQEEEIKNIKKLLGLTFSHVPSISFILE